MPHSIRPAPLLLTAVALLLIALNGCSSAGTHQASQQAPSPATAAVGTAPAPATTPTSSTTTSTPQASGPAGTAGGPAGTAPTSEATSPSTATADPPTSTAPTTPAPGKKVALELLRQSYRDAFETQCQRIWAIAPDGVLYDPADTTGRFTIARCLGDLDAGFGESEDSVAAAAAAGTRDATDVATVLSSSKRLCAAGGTPCWPA